jgi:cytochrome c biogenesis protein CcmG/thiol:disulfide interchange protein DsbE
MERPDDIRGTGPWVDERLALLRGDSQWQPDAAAAFNRFRDAAARHRRRRSWSIAVAIAAAAGVSAFAFPATQTFAQRCVAACVAQTNRLGELLWRPGGGASGRLLIAEGDRQPAPDFTLADRAGRPIALSSYRGRVVLLNFWATWCVPCTREIPWFMEFKKAYGTQGFEVLGVAFDEDGWTSVGPYVDARHVNYPVLLADDRLGRDYDEVSALPTTLLLDREGRIAATHVGLVERDRYDAEIRATLAR